MALRRRVFRHLPAVLLLVIGTMLSIGAAQVVNTSEHRAARYEVIRHASERRTALQRTITQQLDALHAVRALFSASVFVHRAEFAAFVKPLMERHIGLQALEWIPHVLEAERTEYEQRARAENFKEFHFTEHDRMGELQFAQVRSEYFPVYYVEPYSGNEAALGFDLSSERNREHAIRIAHQTGEPTATGRVRLIQDQSESGVLVFLPVYSSTPQATFQGLVLAVLRLRDLLDLAMQRFKTGDVAITLFDMEASAEQRTLAKYGLIDDPTAMHSHTETQSVEVGGRTWAIAVTPSQAFWEKQQTNMPLGVLVIGLLLSILIAGFVNILGGRQRLAADMEAGAIAKSQALMSGNPDTILRIGAKFKVLEVHEGNAVLPVSRPLVLNQPISESLPSAIAKKWHHAIEQTVDQKSAQRIEYPLLCSTGLQVFEARFAPSLPGEILATIRNVTAERSEAQPALEAEARWRSLVAYLEDYIVAVDRGGLVVFWNRALPGNHTLGCARLSDFFFEADRGGLEIALTSVFDSGEPAHLELRGLGPDQIYDVRVGGIRQGDEIVGATMLASDISVRKREAAEHAQLEQQLRDHQKIESLGVLAGGIAHDFNNLLTVIVAGAGLIQIQLEDEEGEIFQLAGEVLNAAERATHLTSQMLAYSGRGNFDIRRINLTEHTRGIVELLESSCRAVHLKLDLADDLPEIEGDVAQIQQVILNLVINAEEAIGDHGGTVSVRTGCRYFGQANTADFLPEAITPGKYVFIEVTDTGVGMDEDVQARIFDPFFTTKMQGRGLGMSALFGIVRGHKGGISVRSQLGEGTQFVVVFPLSKDLAPMEKEDEKGDDFVRGTGTILIIDDEQLLREVASRCLEAFGYSTIVVKSGEEGVKAFQAQHSIIDCVLLDMTMPGMNGRETFDKLCEISTDVPVVFSSGYTAEDAPSSTVEACKTAFLPKPYLPQALIEVVTRLILDRTA